MSLRAAEGPGALPEQVKRSDGDDEIASLVSLARNDMLVVSLEVLCVDFTMNCISDVIAFGRALQGNGYQAGRPKLLRPAVQALKRFAKIRGSFLA
jgi:hypothetical protein